MKMLENVRSRKPSLLEDKTLKTLEDKKCVQAGRKMFEPAETP